MHDATYGGQSLALNPYLLTPETCRRFEVTRHLVHEPAALSWEHRQPVARLFACLERHVRHRELGQVGQSPLDVVLDARRHLVVHPDIVFVAAVRTHIIRERLWGAPDLVVEVLSPGSPSPDRGSRQEWYRHYGARELWLVDPLERTFEVVSLSDLQFASARFSERQTVRSSVLPQMRLRVAPIFHA